MAFARGLPTCPDFLRDGREMGTAASALTTLLPLDELLHPLPADAEHVPDGRQCLPCVDGLLDRLLALLACRL